MIELSLVIGTFIIMSIAVIDVGRLIISRSLLVAGAKEGLNLAIKAPHVANSLTSCNPPPIAGMTVSQCEQAFLSQSERSAQLLTSTNAIITETLQIPLNTFFVDGRGVNPPPTTSFISRLELIRPAEVDASSLIPSLVNDGHPLEHCRNAIDLDVQVNFVGYDMAMLRCPIGVRISAQIETLIPGIGPLSITGEAFGYREFGYFDKEVPEVRN